MPLKPEESPKRKRKKGQGGGNSGDANECHRIPGVYKSGEEDWVRVGENRRRGHKEAWPARQKLKRIKGFLVIFQSGQGEGRKKKFLELKVMGYKLNKSNDTKENTRKSLWLIGSGRKKNARATGGKEGNSSHWQV